MTALPLRVIITGSKDKGFSGIGGGPSGLPLRTAPSATVSVGLFKTKALPSAVSSNPSLIHFSKRAIEASATLGLLGGMKGSDL